PSVYPVVGTPRPDRRETNPGRRRSDGASRLLENGATVPRGAVARNAGGSRTHFDRVATGCLAVRLRRSQRESGRQGSRTLTPSRAHPLAAGPGEPYPATFRQIVSGPAGSRTRTSA